MFSELLSALGARPESWSPRSGIVVERAFLRRSGSTPTLRPAAGTLEALICVDGQMELELAGTHLRVVSPGEVLLCSEIAELEQVRLPQEHATVYAAVLPHAVILSYFQSVCGEEGEGLMLMLLERLRAADGCCTLHEADWYASAIGGLNRLWTEHRGAYLTLRLLERLWLFTGEPQTVERRSALSPTQVDIVRRVRRYLLDHMDRHLTIPEIAAEFDLSPTYLKETFREVCGQPVHHYLQDCRLTRAARLLRTTEQSVLSIALSVGYSGTSRFNAAFKERYGMTPREFRNNAVK